MKAWALEGEEVLKVLRQIHTEVVKLQKKLKELAKKDSEVLGEHLPSYYPRMPPPLEWSLQGNAAHKKLASALRGIDGSTAEVKEAMANWKRLIPAYESTNETEKNIASLVEDIKVEMKTLWKRTDLENGFEIKVDRFVEDLEEKIRQDLYTCDLSESDKRDLELAVESLKGVMLELGKVVAKAADVYKWTMWLDSDIKHWS